MGKFSLGDVLAEQEAMKQVDTERDIPELIDYIGQQLRVGGEAAINAGKGLIEAKQKLKHGEWGDWLAEHFGLSVRQAQRLMVIARNYGDSNATLVSHLGQTKALALLALPESEREDFIAETHMVDGEEKTVIDMSARQLERAIRDREEALAEKDLAEQARAQMAEDMAMTKQLLEAAQRERDAARQEVQTQQEAFQASENEIARITQELESLKAAPTDVAVMEVDQAALDQARADAVAGMQDKLDKAKAAQTREAEKRKQAEAALEEANAKLEAAAKAEKQAAIANNKELASFEAYFTQVQEIINRMKGLMLKVQQREDEKTAGGMQRAMLALAELMGRAAE